MVYNQTLANFEVRILLKILSWAFSGQKKPEKPSKIPLAPSTLKSLNRIRAEFWLEKQPETIHFLFIPFVVCLFTRFLLLSLVFIFFTLSSLRLCLLISSKSDASRYSSPCMISKARPYLREKKDDTFFQSSYVHYEKSTKFKKSSTFFLDMI